MKSPTNTYFTLKGIDHALEDLAKNTPNDELNYGLTDHIMGLRLHLLLLLSSMKNLPEIKALLTNEPNAGE